MVAHLLVLNDDDCVDDCVDGRVDDCVDDRVIAVQYSLKRSRTTKNRRQKRNGEENVSETE